MQHARLKRAREIRNHDPVNGAVVDRDVDGQAGLEVGRICLDEAEDEGLVGGGAEGEGVVAWGERDVGEAGGADGCRGRVVVGAAAGDGEGHGEIAELDCLHGRVGDGG